jgi:FixJ family two-component response regulator
LKRHLIAVVDDDDSVREAMKALIKVLGYSVDTFSSAEEFLQSPTAESASSVIADVQMPGMGGVELQRQMLARGQRIPIIFVTAYPDEAVCASILRDGAIGYLTKPLREESLLECLDRALNPGAT